MLTPTGWPGLTAAEETAYLAYNQQVYAVNLENGLQKWSFPAKADRNISFFAAPSLTTDNQLILGGFNKTIYSLNPANGTENWSYPSAKDRFIGGPLTIQDRIIAADASGKVITLDYSGTEQWSYQTGSAVWTQPVADDACGCVYVGSMDHRVYALDMVTGEEIWVSDDLGGSIVGRPAYGSDGLLFVGTYAYAMIALNAQDGSLVWKQPTQGWVWGGPLVMNGNLYFGDASGTFFALSSSNGTEIWKFDADGPIYDTPLFFENKIFFTSEPGTLYALDIDSGAVEWSDTITGNYYTGPVLAGERILVAPVGADELLFIYNALGTNKVAFTPEKN